MRGTSNSVRIVCVMGGSRLAIGRHLKGSNVKFDRLDSSDTRGLWRLACSISSALTKVWDDASRAVGDIGLRCFIFLSSADTHLLEASL